MSGAPTTTPWSYRPSPDDDWGVVRAPVTEQGRLFGGIICQARDPEALDPLTLAMHREAKTDPWEANARFIVRAVNCHDQLVDALQTVWDAYGFDPSIDSSIWQTVQSALAKATGAAS